ncbi:MAG TPA: hypothetical protein VFA04_04230 [Bryobacteraceae bacterium]|nr:hypothetical protein [Bryobacteraceae bacterium]
MRVLLEDVMPLPFESPWRRPIQVRIQGSVINRIGQLVGAIPQPPPQARVHAARQPRQDRASVMPAHPAQFRTTVRPPIEPVASLSVEPELQQVVGAWLWPVSGRGSARA